MVLSDVESAILPIQYRMKAYQDVFAISNSIQFKADLVLFIDEGTMQNFPLGIHKFQCLTLCYAIDTHMNYDKHLMMARMFDATLLVHKQFVEPMRNDGIQQVAWIPIACEPSWYPKDSKVRDLDIAYVGSMDPQLHPERWRLISRLKQEFPSHFFGPLAPQDMLSTYCRAKIVFNKSIRNDLNMRYFEAMGAGALLITDAIHGTGVEEYFTAGKDYLIYKDENDLLEKINYYLKNESERAAIALNAQQKVLTQHRYLDRTQQILDFAKDCKKQKVPSLGYYFAVYYEMRNYPGMLKIIVLVAQEKIKEFWKNRIAPYTCKKHG